MYHRVTSRMRSFRKSKACLYINGLAAYLGGFVETSWLGGALPSDGEPRWVRGTRIWIPDVRRRIESITGGGAIYVVTATFSAGPVRDAGYVRGLLQYNLVFLGSGFREKGGLDSPCKKDSSPKAQGCDLAFAGSGSLRSPCEPHLAYAGRLVPACSRRLNTYWWYSGACGRGR